MKKIILSLALANYILANDGYTPLNSLSKDEKANYNFIKKSEKNFEVIPLENRKKTTKESFKKEEPIIQNEARFEEPKPTYETVKNEDIKEYKKDSVLHDVKAFKNENNEFSATIRLSTVIAKNKYSDKSSKINYRTKKSLIAPEISLEYLNHSLAFDYLSLSGYERKANKNGIKSVGKLKDSWFRMAYLYNYLNINLGLAYNYYKVDYLHKYYENSEFIGDQKLKGSQNFPTLELHFTDSTKDFVVNYGGFYGKNSSGIRQAYELYGNFGYKPFYSDSLVLFAGYKFREVELKTTGGDKVKLNHRGPTLGISSSF